MSKYSLEVVRYNFEYVGNEPKIVIHQIRVNDENGKYIKFAPLKDVVEYLNKYPVTFRELNKWVKYPILKVRLKRLSL